MKKEESKNRILLFIPAYNCQNQVVRVLNQIDKQVLKYIEEIIVVDNQSTDRTEEMVIKYINEHENLPLRLLKNNENYGLGGSHKVAFDYAIENKFDFIIVLHGDDQGNIRDLNNILKKKIYTKYDCCLGARFTKKSVLKGYSWFRTLGNRVFNGIFSTFLGFHVYDLGSGLNMYRVEMLRNKYYIKFPDDLTFNYCMIMALEYYKNKFCFFPITWREDDQISNVKMVSQAANVLKMLMSYKKNKKKFMLTDLRKLGHKNYNKTIIFESRAINEKQEMDI